jgi:hypothetical protein
VALVAVFWEGVQEALEDIIKVHIPRTFEHMDVPHILYKCNFSAGTIIVNV